MLRQPRMDTTMPGYGRQWLHEFASEITNKLVAKGHLKQEWFSLHMAADLCDTTTMRLLVSKQLGYVYMTQIYHRQICHLLPRIDQCIHMQVSPMVFNGANPQLFGIESIAIINMLWILKSAFVIQHRYFRKLVNAVNRIMSGFRPRIHASILLKSSVRKHRLTGC